MVCPCQKYTNNRDENRVLYSLEQEDAQMPYSKHVQCDLYEILRVVEIFMTQNEQFEDFHGNLENTDRERDVGNNSVSSH